MATYYMITYHYALNILDFKFYDFGVNNILESKRWNLKEPLMDLLIWEGGGGRRLNWSELPELTACFNALTSHYGDWSNQ